MNPRKDTLITGYKDGHIKIHAVDTYYSPQSTLKNQRQLRLREKIEAFPFDFKTNGKKCAV